MPILANFECLLLFIVSGIGIVRYQKLNYPFKILAWSVIILFILAILSRIFNFIYKTNAPILQIESIAQFIFYAAIYYYLFKNKKIKKTIIILIIIISVFFLINALFLQPFNKAFPTNVYIPTQILFAVFSLLLFKEMLMYPLKVNIIRQSIFWYNTAIFFYATTMFFNLGLSNYLAEHNDNDFFIFYFLYFIIYFFNILICISLLTENKKNALADA